MLHATRGSLHRSVHTQASRTDSPGAERLLPTAKGTRTQSGVTWQQRIDNYNKQTGFPARYLRRIKALFPDKQCVLHLFSGRVDLATMPGDTVDITPALNPTYVDDAQRLEKVPLANYDLVMADPPYSVDDAEHYGTTMVKRNTVMKALSAVASGTHIVWLDQVLPMFRKNTFAIEAVIGMVKSTNHRFRVITVFRRI